MKNIISCDTETFQGLPISLQLYDGETLFFEFCNANNISKKFCNALDLMARASIPSTLYFHNIEFDSVSLFYKHLPKFIYKNFSISCYGWEFNFSFASTKFFTGIKGNKSILAVDSASFFYGSLEKLAETFNLSHKKYPKPAKLGEYKYTEENKAFIKYAKQDAVVQWELGEKIDSIHKLHDVTQSVSIANLAQKIFKRKFLRDTIKFPPSACLSIARKSYQGGKNNFYTDIGYYKNVYSLDINSAYPYIMSKFPDFANGEYKRVTSLKKINPLGVYSVRGKIVDMKYTPVWRTIEHYNKTSLWHTTGYELLTAIKHKCFIPNAILGYEWVQNPRYTYSPFKEYVDYFYNQRKQATNPVENLAAKILLNSLYGKFIQTTTEEELLCDVDTGEIHRNTIAGGMYNPFIASLITGWCRARIFELELEYNSIHTSTDGIFTFKKPKSIDGLGGIKVENKGDLLIFRTRLYIHYKEHHKKTDDDRFYKYALHGFRGKVEQLEEMWKTKNTTYEYFKFNKAKESIIQHLQVNKRVKNHAQLDIKF